MKYSKNGRYQAVVIVGPTASGKTSAGVELAKLIGGEVISADSRAIYRGMDIGTAKPSMEEREGIPHWGIDLVDPDERFSAADFKEYVESRIAEIQDRGKWPIVVGGTGLYVDAVVFNYQFNTEVKKTCSDRDSVNKSFLQLGIEVDRPILRKRIEKRADIMFGNKLYDETKRLVEAGYSWDLQSMRSNIYQFAWRYLQGEISLEEAKEQLVRDDMGLAKRQMTWFRRSDQTIWVPREEIVNRAVSELEKVVAL